MLPYADACARSVLCGLGFEEILAVPAIPLVEGSLVGYGALIIVEPGGECWSVRENSTSFRILPPQWIHCGLTRVCSFDEALLLAEAVMDTERAAHVLGAQVTRELVPFADRLAHDVRPYGQRRWSMLVAAELARSETR